MYVFLMYFNYVQKNVTTTRSVYFIVWKYDTAFEGKSCFVFYHIKPEIQTSKPNTDVVTVGVVTRDGM